MVPDYRISPAHAETQLHEETISMIFILDEQGGPLHNKTNDRQSQFDRKKRAAADRKKKQDTNISGGALISAHAGVQLKTNN